jgi:DNA-binding GntR family transcriptional regulator
MSDEGQAESLVDRAVNTTRHRILTGEYPPGSRLRLSQLAEETGVSLIPVREALRVLEAERLVCSVPNKGATVSELSIDDMNDLYAMRILLEGEAVASSTRLTKQEANSREALLVELEAAQEAGDAATTMRLHRDFHFGLYERTESSWLLFVIDILWKHAERYQWLSLQHRSDVANDEHRAILRALERGEMQGAADAVRAHLNTTRGLIENAYMRSASPIAATG